MRRIILILLSLIFLIFGQSCIHSERRVCHVPDFESPEYCLWEDHWVIVLGVSLLEQLSTSNLSFEITFPNWIKYDKLGGFTPVSIAIVDKNEMAFSQLIEPEFKRTDIGNKIILDLKIDYRTEQQLKSIFEKAKPQSYASVSFSLILGNINIYSKEEFVYENFEVSINTYANGNLIDNYSVVTRISKLLTGHLISALEEIPNSAFSSNPNQKRDSLLNKINAVENMIDAKNPQGAYEKLKNDIMAKFDGQNGGNPSDDWIVDPFYSSNLFNNYNKILNVLDYLRN